MTGYTGFSGDVTEQSGHYLSLKFQHSEGATTTIQLLNGIHNNPVALDSDMNCVLRITNKDTQKFKVVTTLDGETITRIYSLSSLNLLPEE